MGVQGLWNLLDQANCGNPVTLESLENVILAIDCSIWLNQIIKGTRDENDYLLNVFKRITKLMHYKIKPVFVFDGGCPELKKRTIQARKLRNEDLRNKQLDRIQKFVKERHNVNLDLKAENLKSTKLRGFRDDNLYFIDDNLNFNDDQFTDEETDNDYEEVEKYFTSKQQLDKESNLIINSFDNKDLNELDTNSKEFLNLPLELRHELLTEIKEIKKFNLVERKLPKDMNDYSTYQIGKLVKGYDIQRQIEKTREEMVCRSTSSSIDSKFKEEYEKYISKRIASDECTNLVFTKKKSKEQDQPKLAKLIEKPKRVYESNIYGTVEEYDYDLTKELDPEAKSGLINERMKKKIEIKKELDDSSTDDSDFVTVQDGTIDDNSLDNIEFNLSKIHPILLFNEKKIVENSAVKDQDLKIFKKEFKKQEFISPNKRGIEQSSPNSLPEPDKKKTNLLANFMDEKNKLVDETFNVTINQTIVLDKDSPLKDEKQLEIKTTKKNDIKSIDESKIRLISSDDEFQDEIEFEKDLNQFLDKIELPVDKKKLDEDKKLDEELVSRNEKDANQSTSFENKLSRQNSVLSINFLESQDNELNVIDKKIIDKLIESPNKLKTSQQSNSQNMPKKELKIVQLKAPTTDQLISNKIKTNSDRTKQDLSESLQLVRDIKKIKRQTNTITDRLIEDTKDLLNLFGIPFIVSPMEAEAQCAILEELNLTKGTITDDGDVWLFGAKTVYKNFYSQSKYVMKYKFEDIKNRLKLSRENLICFAMLTGSDYTDGIKGIGTVTAAEIISEFGGDHLEPLIKFKEWWLENKNSKLKKNKARTKFLKYDLPKSFPSKKVYNAYVKPEVDTSREPVKFGKPDIDLLRKYTNKNFNWSTEKQDQELLPLFKKINDNSTQLKIHNFFRTIAKKEPDKNQLNSKRLQKALDKKLPNIETQEKETNKVAGNKASKKDTTTNKATKKDTTTNKPTIKEKVSSQRVKKKANEKRVEIPKLVKEIKISEYFTKKVDTEKVQKINEVICLSESDSD